MTENCHNLAVNWDWSAAKEDADEFDCARKKYILVNKRVVSEVKFSLFHTCQNHFKNIESEILRGNGEKPLLITRKLGENFNYNSGYFIRAKPIAPVDEA